MKKSHRINIFLFISGIIAIIIGTSLLISPIEFEASSGINIDTSASSLSEVRSSGGLLLFGGIIIFVGMFKHKLVFISLIISSLLYISYGFSRILSLFLDGIPNESILIATIIEIVIGIISLSIYRNISSEKLNVNN